MNIEKVLFGAGCFWGVEESFRSKKGVVETTVGYAGGHTENPTYQQVCGGSTGHAEVVEVEYNPEEISLEELVRHFFSIHDPTTVNRQGVDVGEQYRSIVFYRTEQEKNIIEGVKKDLTERAVYSSPIVTEVSPFTNFYQAEDYHQDYVQKNNAGACH